MKTIGILGSGSWATAIIKILTENTAINWWVRKEEIRNGIASFHRNPSYLSSAELNLQKINLFDNMEQCIAQSDIIIAAVPSAFLKETLAPLNKNVFDGKLVVSAIKGMIPDENLIIAEYFKNYFGVAHENFIVISGPCHAEEVALEKLSYLTLSCPKMEHASILAEALSCRYIKTNVTDDIYGTEISAVMKNIIALCCGICHGLGYGDNFQAVLVSNAIQEIKRFVDVVHPINRDIDGSAYLGDLLVTCYSQFSRNRNFGLMIGKGYSVKAAQLELNMIAEGYYSVKCIHEANQKNYHADLPITEAVYNILYGKMSPAVEIKLLTNKLK